MQEIDVNETRERYRRRWQKYGYDPRTLGWNKKRQSVRFKASLEGLREEDYVSILDVGCGFGDLYGYMKSQRWQGRYLGVDVVPELIEEAKSRYSGSDVSFSCTDISSHSLDTTASMAVALGIFNHRLHQDNMDFVQMLLKAMWKLTTHVVILDFLSTAAEFQHEDLFYADPCAIYELATKFSRRVMIHHAYMPFEFQVKIWHNDSFKVETPVFQPYEQFVEKPK